MRLTVVMSVLNGQPYLSAAVESILNQTFRDFTFIAVNNGSTDNTGAILEKYAAGDDRMRVLHNTVTVTYAEGRTRGIEQADTEWVALMDADDIAEPQRLEKQVQALAEHGDKLAALGTWAHYINGEGKTLGQSVMQPTSLDKFEQMFKDNEDVVIIDPSSIIHRPTFFEVGGYRADAAPSADLDLWFRMAESGRAILVLPEFLMRYRVHGGAESIKKVMLQRKKSHWIKYNMRRRRAGEGEVSWNEYCQTVWARPGYRFKKVYTDLALAYYKHAGLHYGAGQYCRFAAKLLMAALLKPRYVLNRVVFQKLPSLRRLVAGQ